MKYLNKTTILSAWIWLLISFWLVYAAGTSIITTSQTAVDWDIITAQWINAVNTKVNAISLAGTVNKCQALTSQALCISWVASEWTAIWSHSSLYGSSSSMVNACTSTSLNYYLNSLNPNATYGRSSGPVICNY